MPNLGHMLGFNPDDEDHYAVAASMGSSWKKRLYLLMEEPSSGREAFYVHIGVTGGIIFRWVGHALAHELDNICEQQADNQCDTDDPVHSTHLPHKPTNRPAPLRTRYNRSRPLYPRIPRSNPSPFRYMASILPLVNLFLCDP